MTIFNISQILPYLDNGITNILELDLRKVSMP